VQRKVSPELSLVSRARGSFVVALSVAAVSASMACSAVLGLDAPKLDPCADAPCVDGGASDGAVDGTSASDGRAADAKSDGTPVGLRCGGGSFGVTGCTGASPTCCQLTTDAGTTYECRTDPGSCTGYAISCTSNADCSGSEVCCHYSSHIKCVGSTTCANDSLVCEPDAAADQCPSGWKCSASFTNAGVVSPYFGCAP
jgi:hypothetical protein